MGLSQSLLRAWRAQDLEKIQLRRHLLDVRRCCKNLPVERGVVSRADLAFRPGNSAAAVFTCSLLIQKQTSKQTKNYQTGPVLENSLGVEKHSDLRRLELVVSGKPRATLWREEAFSLFHTAMFGTG